MKGTHRVKMILPLLIFILSFSINATAQDAVDQSESEFCEIYRDNLDKGDCGRCGGQWNWASNKCSLSGGSSGGTGYGQSCKERTETAVNICDENKDSGINQARKAAEALTAAGMQNACSEFGQISAGANAALSTFSAGCSKEYMSCKNACDADFEATQAAARTPGPNQAVAEAALEDIKANQRRCSALQRNIASAASGMQNLLASYTNMQQCKADSGDTLAQMCLKDPTLPMCGNQKPADCKDPAQATTNTVCICMTNPRDARCGLNGKTNNYNQSSNSGTDGSGGGDAGSFGDGSFGSGDGSGDIPMGKGAPQADGSLLRGGSGGKGGIGGGGSQGAGGDGYSGRGGAGANTKILNGYYGGGKGGAGYGGGGAGSGDGRPGNPNDPRGGNNAGVDLRQFMPGGKMDPQRGLAGISGPDGITGPHTDIWKKVNKRYFTVSPSLLP